MIASRFYPAPGTDAARVLLVMLPGVGSDAEEFAVRGFISAVHDYERPVDVIAARPDLDLYLDGRITEALHDAVISPALAQGYARLWFLGISLGGLGALLYAASFDAQVEGLVLLAPFLGTPGTIAEAEAAGGIAAWSPQQSRATGGERAALLWLQGFVAQQPAQPALYLGYGDRDRFARGHRLLARHLPPQRVAVTEGGHDWDSWVVLWRQILARRPFAVTGNV